MTQELILNNVGIIARAELDVQINTAKAYPRDVSKAMKQAEFLATLDEETAQSCFYCLPRKEKDGTKKEIRGPSIRLAEIMLTSFGNIHGATRIVENDGKSITAESVCWDLEANVKITTQHKTSIWFGAKEGKGGYQASADMQTVLSNAAAAKALRNAIFKVIPKALVNRIYEKAMSFAIGDQKTIVTKVTDLFDKLTKMGIEKNAILDYYGKKTISEITPEDFKSLIGVGTAIKEGFIRPEEVFQTQAEGDEEEGLSAAQRVSNLIMEKAKLKKMASYSDAKNDEGMLNVKADAD
jgi:hypothetical protein